MPANNVRIEDIKLKDVEINVRVTEDIVSVNEIKGKMQFKVKDSGILPTFGTVSISNIRLLKDQSPDSEIVFLKDETISTTSGTAEKKFNMVFRVGTEDTSPDVTNIVQREGKENLIYYMLQQLCGNNGMKLVCNYNVSGLVTSNSYTDQEIESKMPNAATGNGCRGIDLDKNPFSGEI